MQEAAETLDDIVARCLRETGAGRISDRARDVALVAIMVTPDGALGTREYRRRIKETYLRYSGEYNSFFLLVILPILISVISAWITRWLVGQTTLRGLRTQAFDRLSESLPALTGTRTSTSFPPTNPTGQSK
jgi:hypothetical protein